MTAPTSSPIGILAGGGRLPLEVADVVTRNGQRVHIVGLLGEADERIENWPHTWVNWGGIGAMLGGFKQAGCTEIIILGNVRRPNLARIRPDLGFFTVLPALLKMLKGGDDSVLRRVVRIFESQGLTVRGVHDVAPELVAPSGALGKIEPGPQALEAIALGHRMLAALGPFDLGQAVVAGPREIVEIEGPEGTDAMLARLAERGLRPAEGGPFVLVKAAKPGQEIRVDMPTIGPRTIELAVEAGLAGLAVETGSVLIADRMRTIGDAEEAGRFIIGCSFGEPIKRGAAEATTCFARAGKVGAAEMVLDDARIGASVLGAIAPYWGKGVVVVSRGYVLAIERPDDAARTIERARRNKPWGMGILKRGVGVLVIDRCHATAALATSLAEHGLAAIAVWDGRPGEDLVRVANEARLAILGPAEGT